MAAPSARIRTERRAAHLGARVRRQQPHVPVVEREGVFPAHPADRARRPAVDQVLAHVAEARPVSGAQPLVAGRRQRVDPALLDVDGEDAQRLAAAHDQAPVPLDAAEGVEVLAAAVRVLHVADGDRPGAWGLTLVERLEAQHALDGRHEAHQDAAVDPGQRHGRELQLVGEHRPVGLEQVGDQVHAGRGVGHEGDLARLGADEASHLTARCLAALHPPLPVAVALGLQLAVEAVDGLAHRTRRERRGRRVQVDLARETGEVSPHVVPDRGHGRTG